MAHANYRVTITDHDYHYTTYTAWVQASSKNQAIAMGAALIGGEKTRREWQTSRHHQGNEPWPVQLLQPDVKLEPCTLEEYWAHEDKIEVTTT